MCGISIALNGTCIATLGLAGMRIISASVHRAPDAHAGHGRTGRSGHALWCADHTIARGDVLIVMFDEHCDFAPGAPAAQAAAAMEGDPAAGDAMAAATPAPAQSHAAFVVRLESASGVQAMAAGGDCHADVMFRVLGEDLRESHARLRFTAYGLDSVLDEPCGDAYIRTTLFIGGGTVSATG